MAGGAGLGDPCLLTSGDLRELVEGGHRLQFVRVHLGGLPLQVAGFNLLPGPGHAAVEDAAQSDYCGRGGGRGWTEQAWPRLELRHPRNGPHISDLPSPAYVRLTQQSLAEASSFARDPLGSGILPEISSPQQGGLQRVTQGPTLRRTWRWA